MRQKAGIPAPNLGHRPHWRGGSQGVQCSGAAVGEGTGGKGRQVAARRPLLTCRRARREAWRRHCRPVRGARGLRRRSSPGTRRPAGGSRGCRRRPWALADDATLLNRALESAFRGRRGKGGLVSIPDRDRYAVYKQVAVFPQIEMF